MIVRKRGNRATIAVLTMAILTCATFFALKPRSAYALPLIELSALFYIQSEVSAQNIYECTQVGIDEIDPTLLTKEERIALMDKNLNRSMDSFSHCVSVAQSQMAGGGAGVGNSAGTLNGSQTDDATTAVQTEINNSKSTESEEITVENPTEVPLETDINGTTPTVRGVIPPRNNDKVICKLLYQEIKKTTDNAMLEGLKEQYANYKCG